MTKLSTETFIEQTQNGNIKSAKARVYRQLKTLGPCTLIFLRVSMRMSHQTLTARLSELMDMGIVWQNERNEFYITDKIQWNYYCDLRWKQRRDKWLKVGEKEGFNDYIKPF